MTKLLKDLDAAIESTAENTMLKPMHAVLVAARKEVAAKVEAKAQAQLTSAKQAWHAYRQWSSRLNMVATAMVDARVPEASEIYVTHWNTYGENWSPPRCVISARAKYRLYSGPEYEAAEERGEFASHDGTGTPYVERVMQLDFPETWMWLDDWRGVARRWALEEAVRRSTQYVDSWSKSAAENLKSAEHAEQKHKAEVQRLEKLRAELAALPAEETTA